MMVPESQLRLCNADHASSEVQQTLHGLLDEAAAKVPNKICLKEVNDGGYTYQQVQAASRTCASHVVLFDSEVVLLVADRSYGMLVSMLGVMRAGKAYCPVEPDYPVGRVADVIDTAAIRHALVPASQSPMPLLSAFVEAPDGDSPRGLQAFAVQDDGRVMSYPDGAALMAADPSRVPAVVSDTAAAYVLFTSGSTGKPKGCRVPHRGSTLYSRAVAEVCHADGDMVFLLKTPYVFDVHIQDIYPAFAAGATLVLAEPGAQRDAGAIADTIAQERVNVACFVPTLLVEFVNHLERTPEDAQAVQPHLRRVLTIGEALMASTCRDLLQLVGGSGLEIHNLYGPTEASVGVSHFQATPESLGAATVCPIGKPFGYVDFRIMNHARYEGVAVEEQLLADMPEGEVGELFIGGDCLAHGYINDPVRTGAAFFDFPAVQARRPRAASAFTLYKTGDLVRRRPEDGVLEYLGRCDFQVKIGGVRIECEEVASVLKTHWAVQDALVCDFEGPFGKTLAAYVVVDPNVDLRQGAQAAELSEQEDSTGELDEDLVEQWGKVYNEMYQEEGSGVSERDPTLNWSGYTDTYSRQVHMEPVIAEWVEWSCELVLRHTERCFPAAATRRPGARPPQIVELGCGNGMLLFRIAPVVTAAQGGRYIGTDISSAGLHYVNKFLEPGKAYEGMAIETRQIAAHEVLHVCEPQSNDVVLCNGVTMYFPSAAYLIECMQTAVEATADAGFAIFGDIQSKRHLQYFHIDVQTYQALRNPDATANAVLRAARKAAATEQLSYFDDALFHQLERSSEGLFGGRVARVEMRLKRGWWHSEFSRFRYDIELVVEAAEEVDAAPLHLERHGHAEVCAFAGTPCVDEREISGEEVETYVAAAVAGAPKDVDGIVVTLPNARTLRPVRLLAWMEAAEKEGNSLQDLPHWLRPVDVEEGGLSQSRCAKYGVEPEALFQMRLPEGWTQRVIFAEDPAMLELVLLRNSVSERRWLSALREGESGPKTAQEFEGYKNRQEDYRDVAVNNPKKICHDVLREWAPSTSLLPAMRPAVYVALSEFPKNQAGKVDRKELPEARHVLEEVSDAAAFTFEVPETEEERQMAACWEAVLKIPVSVNTPFIAYGGNSLSALQLCSRVHRQFGSRPDLAFLTSADCSLRALLRQLRAGREAPEASGANAIVRLSPASCNGLYLLILGGAGTSAVTYREIVKYFDRMQVYAVELPGRGGRAGEPLETDFEALRAGLQPHIERWAAGKRFFMWGDSLGAVLAYEIAKRIPKGLLGLCVSGNSGPTVAAQERGMGECVEEYIGRPVGTVAEMTRQDWKQFLLASSAQGARAQLEEVLKDEALAEQTLAPLIADCAAYESYSRCDGEKLREPILTVRGCFDRITPANAMRSWDAVAGGRAEHIVLEGAGHTVVADAPKAMAKAIEYKMLPDVPQDQGEFGTARASVLFSSQQGSRLRATSLRRPKALPRDPTHGLQEEGLKVLRNASALTPPTARVKQMRAGNMRWRLGHSHGWRNDMVLGA